MGRSRCVCGNDVILVFRCAGCQDVDWILVAQAFVNAALIVGPVRNMERLTSGGQAKEDLDISGVVKQIFPYTRRTN